MHPVWFHGFAITVSVSYSRCITTCRARMHAQLLGVDLCMVLLRVHKGPFEFSHQSPHMWSCSVAGVAPGSANMYCIHTYVRMYVRM